jgi:hypothetical protein
MVDGRRRETWNHTAHLLAMLANCHRDEKRRKNPFLPGEFNPTIKRPKVKLPTMPVSVLKPLFVDQRVR